MIQARGYFSRNSRVGGASPNRHSFLIAALRG
jgi:hypothetical protein